MDKPTIVFSPLQTGVPAAGGAVDLLVRLRAPERPADSAVAHLPKRLALVVDRSGSMSGRPLAEALRCVEHIASHLTPQDALSLVVYDHEVQVLVPLQSMGSMDTVRRAITGVESGGNTDLHAGWLAGAEQLEGGTATAISRVMLLSDGQANHGLTALPEVEAQCRTWLGRGVTTTTVGLGRNFNEDLMVGMARAGGGQNYYGQTAADLYDSFDEELALLQAMFLRQPALKLIPAPGVVVEMLSPAIAMEDGRWRMTDLAWASESWLAIRLHLSPSAPGTVRDLLAASISGTAMDGVVHELTAPLLQLPVLESAALALLPRDETVHSRLEELAFAKAAEQLRKLAQVGDREATEKALAALDVRFGQHPWLRAKIEQLRQLAQEDTVLMMKEARYSMTRMSNRLASLDDLQYAEDETNSLEVAAFLRKKVQEGRGKQR